MWDFLVPMTNTFYTVAHVSIAVSLGNSSLKVMVLTSLKWFSLIKREYLSQISTKLNLFLPILEADMILMAFVVLQALAVAPDSAGNLVQWHLVSFMENVNISAEALRFHRSLSVRTMRVYRFLSLKLNLERLIFFCELLFSVQSIFFLLYPPCSLT